MAHDSCCYPTWDHLSTIQYTVYTHTHALIGHSVPKTVLGITTFGRSCIHLYFQRTITFIKYPLQNTLHSRDIQMLLWPTYLLLLAWLQKFIHFWYMNPRALRNFAAGFQTRSHDFVYIYVELSFTCLQTATWMLVSTVVKYDNGNINI